MAILRVLQSAANNKKCSAAQTWDTINHEISPEGAPAIDFESFSALHDSNPTLFDTLVDRFDENGLVVKTNHMMAVDQEQDIEKPIPDISKLTKKYKPHDSEVEKMAKHGLKI